jgi:hypothetical protein
VNRAGLISDFIVFVIGLVTGLMNRYRIFIVISYNNSSKPRLQELKKDAYLLSCLNFVLT